MADLAAPIAVSPALVAPPATAASTADLARSKARDAARTFEGQFLSMMLQQMFAGVKADGPFGGGFGEEMFRSVMTDAMGRQMARAGGIGLADTIQREILKMQGLT
jgi:Rod binding domain-containing protein